MSSIEKMFAETSLSRTLLYDTVAKLRKLVRFTIDISLPSLGLGEIIFFIRKPPSSTPPYVSWLVSVMRSVMPSGFIFTYYYPRKYGPWYIVEAFENWAKKDLDYYFYFDAIRARPALTKFFNYTEGHFHIGDDLWRGLWRLVEENDTRLVNEVFNQEVSAPHDWFDLLILRSLQKDALARIKEIAADSGIRPWKIRRHLREHVMKHVRSISLALTLYDPIYSLQGFAIIDVEGVNDLNVVEAFTRSPIVIGVAFGENRKRFMMFFNMPASELENFVDFVNNIGGVELVNLYLTSYFTYVRMGIPYTNYNQAERYWEKEPSRIEEKMVQKLERMLSLARSG